MDHSVGLAPGTDGLLESTQTGTLRDRSAVLYSRRDGAFLLFCLLLLGWSSSRIVHFPWQMSEAKVQHVLQEAFGVWSAVTPLRFREVTSDNADIIIDFNR